MPPKIDIRWFWKGSFEAIIVVARYTWWLYLLALIRPLSELALRAWQRGQDAKAGLPEIDKMNGTRFEEWLVGFFRARGYKVKTTPKTGDYGVDLIVSKDGLTTAVQAKCWKNKVGVAAVQAVHTGKAHYKTDAALVVTNSRYTDQAKHLAKTAGVALWDRETLRQEILAGRSKPQSRRHLKQSPRRTQTPDSF